MSEKIKHDIMCRLSDRWRSKTCLLEMAPVLQTLVKNPYSYCFCSENEQRCPNKMVVCNGGRFWNFIQVFKEASFI